MPEAQAAVPCLVYFSKMFQSSDLADLIRKGHEIGADGYDLAVRPGYLVTPDNPGDLPEVVRRLRSEGLEVPMVTGPTNFTDPADNRAEPLLQAMDKADVRVFKLGYFRLNPEKSYQEQVDAVRKALAEWEKLGRRYGIRVCYHTHSGPYMGLNAAGLAHLMSGYDPEFLGAYLDPGHLLKTGEPFELAAAIAGPYLAAVGAKDRSLLQDRFVLAGEGDVDWEAVFRTLAARGFSGPVSVHAEYELESFDAYYATLRAEMDFFRRHLEKAWAGVSQ